jgi:hypothetical protein
MKKLFAWVGVALAALMMVGCDDGERSPDFDAQLVDVVVTGPAQAVQDTQAQFRALGRFTTPPSQQGALATSDVTNEASWSVVQSEANKSCEQMVTAADNATVNGNGLVTAVKTGTVIIKAALKGKVGCAPFTVTPKTTTTPVLRRIDVTPAAATIAAGATQQYCARGHYSDQPNDTDTREIVGAVVWSSLSAAVATVPAAPNNTGGCITATGIAPGTTVIRASSVNEEASTLTGDGQITVTSATVKTVLRVVPAAATVPVGSTQEFVACGTFSDSGNATDGPCASPPQGQAAGQPIADTQLNWTSGTVSVATIDDQGVATGIAAGNSVITATLKDGIGDPAPAPRSATATLSVTAVGACVSPLLASGGATIATDKGALCLACSVDNPEFIIDDDALTYGRINATVSLLDLLGLGFINITVSSPTVIPAGQPAGFLIGRPINDLLTAEVLSQSTVSTLLSGVEQESFSDDGDFLRLELLGTRLIGIGDEILATPATTKSFDALRLTFSPTLASVLSQLYVFQACAVANPDAGAAP